MKVKLLRQSLNPIEIEVLTEMMEEYEASYDTILENAGGDMKSVHEQVEDMIKDLSEKYKSDCEVEVELPTSGRKWNDLLSRYGTIALGTHVDTGKLCLMILDSEDNGIAP